MTTKSYDYYIGSDSKNKENSYQKIKNLAKKWKPVKEFIWWEKSNKYWFFKGYKNTFQLNLKNFENYKNIITNQNHDIQNLPYWSFYLNVWINLKKPYYSWDDDFFYPIDNPVRKEKVTKKPYISGGQWKWFMLSAAKKLVQEDFENEKFKYWINKIIKIWRIFGSGNDEFLGIYNEFKKLSENKIKSEDFDKKFIEYLMFEMWVMVSFQQNDIKDIIWKVDLFDSRRGRLVLLPSFFKEIWLEVINPHNRKTRTWTSPIHFETIAKEQESKLQMYYIPFDLVGQKSNDEIKKEVGEDIQFLGEILEKLQKLWIWAKNKYGWGDFESIILDFNDNFNYGNR